MRQLALLILFATPLWAQTPDLLLYAPFDGSGDAAVAGGDGRQRDLLSFVEGLRGQAVSLSSDCQYGVKGNFRAESGTIALWVRPHWNGTDATNRYLFCLYGQRGLPHSYAVNRYNLDCGGGTMRFTIFTRDEGKTVGVASPIKAWRAGQWHHLAVTWDNVNSGQPDGEMKLYLDGAPAASLTGKHIDVGPTNDVMAIGRDQDASPDYADADLDDLFIYSRPLSPEQIAQGVEAVRRLPYEVPTMAASRASVPGWWDTAWPYRVRVEVPPAATARRDLFVRCPLRAGGDLSALGERGTLDPGSLRVVQTATDGKPQVVPVRVEDGLADWVAPGETSAAGRSFWLYFQSSRFTFPQPLVAQRVTAPVTAPAVVPAATDYATVELGKPWNFDDGSFSGIDQWGDKPEYLRNRKVENGILSMDVKQDPWFIWGDMWGQVNATNQKIAIDLDKYPTLEMKVRQSLPQAKWGLFGRVGAAADLLHHAFIVSGSGWQRVRIDLRRDARWSGILSAFRIDPTEGAGAAHIEIDWVRLLALTPVEHGQVETLGQPTGVAARIDLSQPDGAAVVAGSAHELALTVNDAAGKPVAGQPVRISLADGSGGSLAEAQAQRSLEVSAQSRMGVTGPNGKLVVRYTASRQARKPADALVAQAQFTPVPEAQRVVITTPGAPHHYLVQPTKVLALKPDRLPLHLTARLVDEFDNPVANPTPRKLQWSSDERASLTRTSPSTSAGLGEAAWRGDESQRWVYTVRVKDDQGLTGESAPICLLPTKPRQNPIVLGPNGYFRQGKDGRAWVPLGGFYANWVGLPEDGEEGRKLISFVDATEEQMNHWLDFLASQGVTAMRFMLRAHTKLGMEPMDVIGRVNMPLFARVLRYMDLARRHDIKFLLVIHEDYTKPAYFNRQPLEAFCLPQYAGEDLDKLPPYQRGFIRDRKLIGLIGEKYTDPDVMACQDQYTRELLGLLKDNPQLFGWEFENEMVNCPQSWAQHMAGVIRSVDPVTPICASHGGGGLHTGDPLWWSKKADIDFYTYHLYSHRDSTSEVTDYGAAVHVLTTYGRMAGTCMLGESAGDEFGYYPKERDADRRYIMRDTIWFSLVNGNPGCFFWNSRGFEVEEFRLARKVVSGLDLAQWERKRPEVGIVVDHPWEDDKYYRSPQGRADYAMMGRYAQHYLTSGGAFDFTMQPNGYAQTADLKTFAPPPATGPVTAGKGWQVASLEEVKGQGLAYIRNFAGVRHWEYPGKTNMFLRDRRPEPLVVKLSSPGKLALTATDLDTGVEKRVEMTGPGELNLGTTDHDWALVWKVTDR
ncbi:MAG: LamG-like jellyroll fold domain-containing protein [Armatimonadia bacterium]